MSIPRTVSEILGKHVTLEVEGIDRMYLNVYVPALQRAGGVASFFRFHLGHRFASSALMDPITKAFIARMEQFAKQEKVPIVAFEKGQRKDDVAAEYRNKFTGQEGVLFIGKAQEKTPVFRTERRRNEKTGATYPWLVRSTAMVNHFYLYCVDRDFGPFLLKFSTYFPYNAKLCINGHEYAKQQLANKGSEFQAMEYGVHSCDGPVSQRTPVKIRTRVITDGVVPSLHVDYKSTRIKQYHKEGRALRTETTINNTRDFGIGKLLKNLPELRQLGFHANRRLLDVQTLSHDCSIGEDAFEKVVRPIEVEGQRASALRFGDAHVQALLSVLVLFSFQLRGFTNQEMRALLAQLLGLDPAHYPVGRMTYDLRRLRLHGLIQRIPKSHRYEITPAGLRIALFFTRTYARLLRPKLAEIMPVGPPADSTLRAAFDHLQAEIDRCCEQQKLVA